ncbi:MAG TPA: thioredoxin domain-containing protein [Sphingomicrobium sp.]|jgi:protein-disulfide isomerase|nr:thioredoxin domain-containing protein [Sphingomicrobium sp.]
MKPSYFLAGAVAVIAIAGCNSRQGDAATNAPVNVEPVAPPKGGDWSEVVSATPAGGFLMGNPDAKVQLVEYGSLTCPHCREFDEKGVPDLIANYVKTGQVSYEFRNYVRDAFDLTASLIVRCNGANSFFPLTRAMYEDQPNWVAKIQQAPQAQLEQLQNLPPSQEFLAMAKVAGFQDWAAARGVPAAKSSQCLSDENAVNQLVQMNSDATEQFPDFAGTPTFVINGKMVEKTATWELLEPQLRTALGERG